MMYKSNALTEEEKLVFENAYGVPQDEEENYEEDDHFDGGQ